MLWQKKKNIRNLWKISNDLTKKTMRLRESIEISLPPNYWRKKDLEKITISELVQRAEGLSRGLYLQLWIKRRDSRIYLSI